MFQNKPRRFSRRRPMSRGGHSHNGGGDQPRLRSNSFSHNQSRNKFRPSLSTEKLLEKYNTLAKEAISSGDKTLGENYLQHADHYMRVIEDRNKIRSQTKINVVGKPIESNKSLPTNNSNKVSPVKSEE
jgi:hypothetical protein